MSSIPLRPATWMLAGLCLLAVRPQARAQIHTMDQLDTKAKFTDRAKPTYPTRARINGTMGEGIVRFVIDADGRLSCCEVVAQTAPEFGRAALEAVRRWRAQPGLIGGRPVDTRWQVPIVFVLNEGNIDREATAFMYGFPAKVPAKLPAEFRYDTQPQAEDTPAPIYPYDDWIKHRAGSAEAAYVIDPAGRLRELQIFAASSPEFGRALAAAIERWKFKPATRGGKPCFAPARLKFSFNLYVPDDAPENRLRKVVLENPAVLAKLSDLDHPLQPLNRVAPRYPFALAADGRAGQAVVECIVDREGWVRLPRMVSATREEFGWAAAAALAEWRFAVPVVKGQPADVVVQVPFEFAARR